MNSWDTACVRCKEVRNCETRPMIFRIRYAFPVQETVKGPLTRFICSISILFSFQWKPILIFSFSPLSHPSILQSLFHGSFTISFVFRPHDYFVHIFFLLSFSLPFVCQCASIWFGDLYYTFFFSFQKLCRFQSKSKTIRLCHTVVTAIQGLIDAADEQLMKRENSEDLSKVSISQSYDQWYGQSSEKRKQKCTHINTSYFGISDH